MNDIIVYDKIQDPIVGIEKLGKFFAESGMFGCTKTQQGMVLALTCMTRRMDPIEFRNTYHLIDGNVSMRADAMLAKFRERGGKHKVIARTPETASVELTNKDGEKHTFVFTWTDAQAEPFVWDKDRKVKKNYATPRARMQMLWARVVSDGVRTMAPEINFGTMTPEELDDTPDAPAPNIINGNETPPPKGETITVQSETVTTPEPFKAQAGTDGRLTIETVRALLVVIPDDTKMMAGNFLVAHEWMKPGEDWGALSVNHAQQIFDRTPYFIEAVKTWQAAQDAKTEETAQQQGAA